MYAEERQNEILELLKKHQKASISDLSDRFSVTMATIRSDVRLLEEKGLIIKTHGGVLLKSANTFELISETRKTINQSCKKRIGARAAELVQDGQTIILDTGTTSYHIATHLSTKRNLTVITNDFEVARILDELDDSIQIIFLGGLVKRRYHCAYHFGETALLQDLNVDIAFMGANAMSAKTGASVADLNLAETKKAMTRRSQHVVIVCDSTKLGQTSLAQFASPDQIATVISDQEAEDLEAYADADIEFIKA